MADRTTTPDILGDLMSGEPKKKERAKTSTESQNTPITAIKLSKNKATTEIAPPEEPDLSSSLPEGISKEKSTFSLPTTLLNKLEDKWMEMRKLSGSRQVSKALIVEEALKMAFADFDLKKQTSKFYSDLINNNEIEIKRR